MVQTSFTVADQAGLTTALQGISSGGTNAAVGTAYTITATAAILADSETVNLLSGSSLTLQGGFPFIVNAFSITGSVVADLNLTGTITLDKGTFVNDVTSVTNGTIVAGLFTGAIFGVANDGGDTVINNGTMIGGPSYAIDLSAGTVQNGWNGQQSALITGVLGGVALLGNGLLQNGGTIATTGTSNAAVFLGSGTVDNGQLGDTTATISGGFNGVEITGAGAVNNDGTIANLSSDAVYLGSGMVTNGQIGDSAAWIDGGSGNGVSIASGVGTIANYGTITGAGGNGVYLASGGTVTNGAPLDTTALITGSTIGVFVAGPGALLNFGTVSATGGAGSTIIGAAFTAGGTIENLGTAATIIGDDWGASVVGGKGFVINLGTIEATSQSAPGLGLDLNAGGSVINGTSTGSGATISGSYDGVRISAGAAGAGASVVNNGTITGLTAVDFQSGPTAATGTLTNNGMIESTNGPSGNAVVFGTGTERLVLQSAGVFVGQVVGGSAGSSTTMELASGTNGTLSALGSDAGTVSDSVGRFGFTAFETIVVDSGATWAIAAPGTLDTLNNAGALSLSGGSATVSGPFANSGILAITGNTLVAASGSVADSGLIAVSGGGVLQANGTGVTVSGIFGTSGALTVAGVGSELLAPSELNIGQGGDGSVLIQNQATAIIGGNTADALAGLVIGQNGIAPGNGVVPGSGAATVSNALLSNTGRFIVGDAGLGSLSVTSAGTVTTSADATIAAAAGSDGSSVSVTGADSNLKVAGALTVGAAAAGALSINAGATVAVGSLDVGLATSSSGVVTLTGSHTALTTTGALSIGDGGIGELSVLNGATVVTGGDVNIGQIAGGSGNLDIEGNSTFTVGGNLNLGAGGPAVLTLGPSAVLQVDNGIIFGNPTNASLILFNTIDPLASDGVPQKFINPGTQTYTWYVKNSAFSFAPNIAFTVQTPVFEGSAVLSINTGDTLTLDAGNVSSGTTIAFTDATGQLVIGTDTLATIQVTSGSTHVAEANPLLDVPLIGGFAGVIGGFVAGDTVTVQTDGAATFSQTGSVVSVIQNGATLGALRFDSVTAAAAAASGGLVDQVLCFLPDTLIATPAGEVKVQHLAPGDLVRTASGVDRPVIWIGEGRVLAPPGTPWGRRSAATPVIVRRGALGPGVPHYDLHVTKGHALFIDDVLIPVEFLVNHRSILWDDQAREVSLYHVELETHDVLLANGAPAESYRDDGNRWLFRNANSGWDQPEKPPCAPVLTGGPVVDAVWQRLLARSGPRPGLPLTDDPDMHLVVDGVRVDGARAGDRCVFRLRPGAGPGAREVRLVSRAAAPAELGLARDPRVLGVAVRQIELWQGPRVCVVDADDERLADGFHAYEPDGAIRWTDGDAVLPVDAFAGDAELVVLLGGTTRYADTEGEVVALQSVA